MDYPETREKIAESGNYDQGEKLENAMGDYKSGFTTAAPANIAKVQDGICRALCCLWANARVGNSKLITKDRLRKIDLADACTMQEEVTKIANQLNCDSTVATREFHKDDCGEKMDNIGEVEEIRPHGIWSTPSIVNLVLGSKKLPMIISYKFDGGGHGIAVYQSSGKAFGRHKHVYFFDPNLGECILQPHEFEKFLETYKKEAEADCGAKITGYKVMGLHPKK